MKNLVSLNGTLVPAEDAVIRALSPAALYGHGVFTTMSVLDGEPFLLEKHLSRLRSDSTAACMRFGEKQEQDVRANLRSLLETRPNMNGRCRITFFSTFPSPLWPHVSESTSSLLITLGDFRPRTPELRLRLSEYRVNSRSPLAGVKSCNYLENTLAFENARMAGFDESVRLNERIEITSTCMANIFWLKDDRLFTPALSTGCIPGITREYVLDNLACEEVAAPELGLQNADAIFLTSSGLGIRQATSYGKRIFRPSSHPILDLLPF